MSWRQRKAATIALAAMWSFGLEGCYVSLPVQQGPAPVPERVQLLLNDQGRAALSEHLGPMVAKVEGQMLAQDEVSYTIAVARVLKLTGGDATWNGEQMTIRREHTTGFQIRRFDKTRTVMAAGLVVVLTVALVFGKQLGIIGGGLEDSGDNPDPPPSLMPRRP